MLLKLAREWALPSPTRRPVLHPPRAPCPPTSPSPRSHRVGPFPVASPLPFKLPHHPISAALTPAHPALPAAPSPRRASPGPPRASPRHPPGQGAGRAERGAPGSLAGLQPAAQAGRRRRWRAGLLAARKCRPRAPSPGHAAALAPSLPSCARGGRRRRPRRSGGPAAQKKQLKPREAHVERSSGKIRSTRKGSPRATTEPLKGAQ
ncbi:Hypothetical predicted protein [Marmota monax]|uniref:Uncharacterized protein n=1 Tax=Marmota monax TaxID=9995 RepID=A0A5E4BRP5_MARMO|nr:hypothetical protein GHT09_006710 [Marmota monax]VTJ71651.1 Hypothetical predicted protein [Marmota monax]